MGKSSSSKSGGAEKKRSTSETAARCAQRHFRIGWWSLLVFLVLGIVLEGMHGFKIGWFLDVGMETRRLMWRLAHAHGTLLALVHLGFGGTALWAAAWPAGRRNIASHCLTVAGILLPVGFFLGGLYVYDGDPGLGILLVPPGALALLAAVLLTALDAKTKDT